MDSKGCISCGQCCTTAQLSVIVTEDLAHYYSNFGVETFKDKEGNFVCRFRVPTICRHLSRDVNGKSSCDIYENRPQICRDYPMKNSNLHKGCGYE